jgi:putative tricarboxylic transport membrane protein
MALMLGAMMVHDIQPGPSVVTSNPELFWGLVASMWIGNLMLLVLNLPLVGMWVKVLQVPYQALYPAILTFCCIGVYSVRNSVFDIYLVVIFGVLGYVFRRLSCEPTPLILGFILGPLLEEHFRRAMVISQGDPTIFLTSPISATLLALAALMLLLSSLSFVRKQIKEKIIE